MFDNGNGFACRVGVLCLTWMIYVLGSHDFDWGSLTLISKRSELGKSGDQSIQNWAINIRSVLDQHLLLWFKRRIVNGKTGEWIATGAKEIISKEWETRSIGQGDDAEIWMQLWSGILLLFRRYFDFWKKNLMENIDSLCSRESQLTFVSICSIRIRSRIWDIFEINEKKSLA